MNLYFLMNKIFIYIEINDLQKVSYQKDQFEWMKRILPEVQLIDFDNFSEAFIIDKSLEILNNSDKIFILIEQKNNSKEHALITRFMNKLVRQKNKEIKILLNGENEILAKMSKTLGTDHFYQNIRKEDQQLLLKDFFKD